MDVEAWARDRIEPCFVPSGDAGWLLTVAEYDPAREAEVEACFAVSNGFLGVRASRAVSRGAMWVTYQHYFTWASWPRTYVAGLFDTPNTLPPVPSLVPAPDWMRLRVWIDGQDLLLRSGEVQKHSRILDMRRGILLTEWEHRHPSGRLVRVKTLRLVSFASRALAVQLLQLGVDGNPVSVRLEAFLESTGSALETLELERDAALWKTAESGKTLAIATRARLQLDGRDVIEDRSPLKWAWSWSNQSAQPAQFVRLAAFAKGGIDQSKTKQQAAQEMAQAEAIGWPAILAAHERSWGERWRLSDIEIAGDQKLQRALRFAIYHLNGAVNPDDERVSIGARALTGDSYLGHVFWDTEIYLLPFYVFTWPEAARALLMYRFHTLAGARAKATRLGYRGALYAWESADSGEETTPEKVIDPHGRAIPVLCGLEEHHISADIAYAVWQYWQGTQDDTFFLSAGAEILLETARFWASRATLEKDGHYHIRRVIGPDEYHETIDDNAYTNTMAAWNIERGLDAIKALDEHWPAHSDRFRRRLALDDAELADWKETADRLVRGYNPSTGMIEQFAGYFNLEDIHLGGYSGRTVPMDVILGRERTQASQVIKQADVVALLALLPDLYDNSTQRRNFTYYETRCGHGSTLSTAMHALVAARLGDAPMAEHYLRATAEIDLGSLTISSAGGVHIAALGGLWLAVVFGFAGFRPMTDELVFNPSIPEDWQTLAFRIQWRGRITHVQIDPVRKSFVATLEKGDAIFMQVTNAKTILMPGTSCDIRY